MRSIHELLPGFGLSGSENDKVVWVRTKTAGIRRIRPKVEVMQALNPQGISGHEVCKV